MKNLRFLPVLAPLCGAILFPLAPALAAPAKPDVLWYFNRVPASHFAPFGDVSRASLLKRKGVIHDRKYRFLEIPISAQATGHDIASLQITVFRSGSTDTVAVNRVVWSQPRVSGKLTFYRLTGTNKLRDVTRTVWPFRLEKHSFGSDGGAWESAYLPRRGAVITTGLPESDHQGYSYAWSQGRFTQRNPTPRDVN